MHKSHDYKQKCLKNDNHMYPIQDIESGPYNHHIIVGTYHTA